MECLFSSSGCVAWSAKGAKGANGFCRGYLKRIFGITWGIFAGILLSVVVSCSGSGGGGEEEEENSSSGSDSGKVRPGAVKRAPEFDGENDPDVYVGEVMEGDYHLQAGEVYVLDEKEPLILTATDRNANDTLRYSFMQEGTEETMESGSGEVATAVLDDGSEVSALFDVNAETGAITAKSLLDYEAADEKREYRFKVQVVDSTGLTDETEVIIRITDNEADNMAPEFSVLNYTGVIIEGDYSAPSVAGQVNDAASGNFLMVVATDANLSDEIRYALVSDSSSGVFSIDANTGVITATNVLNYEGGVREYTVMVEVSDSTGLTNVNQATVIITVTDDTLDNRASAFAFGSYSGEIDEGSYSSPNSAGEVRVLGSMDALRLEATDPDAVVGEGPMFRIKVGNGDGLFEVDPSTGVITAVGDLDAETEMSYTLEVEVMGRSGTDSDTAGVIIQVGDVNEFFPVLQVSYEGSIDEGDYSSVHSDVLSSAGGNPPLVITATDEDITSTLNYKLEGTDASLFSIDGNTKVLKAVAILDYDTTPAKTSYVLKVVVDDGVNTERADLIITLNGLNDNVPGWDPNVGTVSKGENLMAGALIIGIPEATDLDGDTLSYGMEAGSDHGSFFTFDEGSLEVKAGVTRIDYDVLADYDYDIIIIADDGDNTARYTLTVTITNENDNVPEWDPNVGTVSKGENLMAGALIIGIPEATDLDGDTLSYGMEAGSDHGSFFTFDEGSLEVKAGDTRIDYDVLTDYDYDIIIIADDGDNTARYTLTVTITNENDNVPVFVQGAYAGNIQEGSYGDTRGVVLANTAGNPALVVNATDGDTGDTVRYELADTSSVFDVDLGTGAITAIGALNYDDHGSGASVTRSYTLKVKAIDSGDLEQEVDVTITITDTRDDRPMFVLHESVVLNGDGTAVDPHFLPNVAIPEKIARSLEVGNVSSFSLSFPMAIEDNSSIMLSVTEDAQGMTPSSLFEAFVEVNSSDRFFTMGLKSDVTIDEYDAMSPLSYTVYFILVDGAEQSNVYRQIFNVVDVTEETVEVYNTSTSSFYTVSTTLTGVGTYQFINDLGELTNTLTSSEVDILSGGSFVIDSMGQITKTVDVPPGEYALKVKVTNDTGDAEYLYLTVTVLYFVQTIGISDTGTDDVNAPFTSLTNLIVNSVEYPHMWLKESHEALSLFSLNGLTFRFLPFPTMGDADDTNRRRIFLYSNADMTYSIMEARTSTSSDDIPEIDFYYIDENGDKMTATVNPRTDTFIYFHTNGRVRSLRGIRVSGDGLNLPTRVLLSVTNMDDTVTDSTNVVDVNLNSWLHFDEEGNLIQYRVGTAITSDIYHKVRAGGFPITEYVRATVNLLIYPNGTYYSNTFDNIGTVGENPGDVLNASGWNGTNEDGYTGQRRDASSNYFPE